jgi:hypothetical protein
MLKLWNPWVSDNLGVKIRVWIGIGKSSREESLYPAKSQMQIAVKPSTLDFKSNIFRAIDA